MLAVLVEEQSQGFQVKHATTGTQEHGKQPLKGLTNLGTAYKTEDPYHYLCSDWACVHLGTAGT